MATNNESLANKLNLKVPEGSAEVEQDPRTDEQRAEESGQVVAKGEPSVQYDLKEKKEVAVQKPDEQGKYEETKKEKDLDKQVAALKPAAPTQQKQKPLTGAQLVHHVLGSPNQRGEFAKALSGSGMDEARFLRILITKISTDEKLMEALVQNPVSVISSCLEMAQQGLDPAIPNEAFLVAYKGVCTLQRGYKGLQKLAIESARDAGVEFKTLFAREVCEFDSYERGYGDTPFVRHSPPPFPQERGKVVLYYAVAKDSNGKIDFREMLVKDIQEHQKKFSKALKFGPYADGQNFDQYGQKTVLKQLIWRDLPMGPKLARALETDIEMQPEEPAKATLQSAKVVEIEQ